MGVGKKVCWLGGEVEGEFSNEEMMYKERTSRGPAG